MLVSYTDSGRKAQQNGQVSHLYQKQSDFDYLTNVACNQKEPTPKVIRRERHGFLEAKDFQKYRLKNITN